MKNILSKSIITLILLIILLGACRKSTKSNSVISDDFKNDIKDSIESSIEDSIEIALYNEGMQALRDMPDWTDEEWEEFSQIDNIYRGVDISWLWGVWEGKYGKGINSFPLYIYFKQVNDSIYKNVKLRDSDAIVYFNNDKGEYFEGYYMLSEECDLITLWSGEGYKYEFPISFENKNISGFKRIGKYSSEMIAKAKLRETEKIENIHKENRRLADLEYKNNSTNSLSSKKGSSLRLTNEAAILSFLNNRNYISKDWIFMISGNTVYLDNNPIGTVRVKQILSHEPQMVELIVQTPYNNAKYSFITVGEDIIKDQEGRIYRYRSY
ncbi:hypothetical protein E2605_08530 [Dysgonomonas capnocytophagoides]|uniref:Uncharacterized protein n=1 Tax=Dysgonomonas capnocytophagoides TaxID=45254 RepID=A0A4Y8L2H4_9BACT|nr:hypothetical protein [Dysgonomonas capnocytophagoides]TFD96849.1 hypothetical protein E2605_08530 [Dysgonomonas capnocytophagoides]